MSTVQDQDEIIEVGGGHRDRLLALPTSLMHLGVKCEVTQGILGMVAFNDSKSLSER